MMKTFDFSNPTLFNPIYIDMFNAKQRTKIVYGGRDSGKSDGIAQEALMCLLGDPFFRMILSRREHDRIKESQYQTIVDYITMWNLTEYIHFTSSPIKIVNKLNPNNKIIARGLDKPDNTKSIKDATAIWLEEADQISENAYDESVLTLRSSYPGVKIREWLSFNPGKEGSWLNKRFFPNKLTYEQDDGRFHFVKSIQPNTFILHTNYRDNRFITSERIEKLENYKNIDENLYRVNTLGLWGGALKGLVYPNFKKVHNYPESGEVVFGLDYGLNDPTALVQCTYYDQELYTKELIYQSGLTHPDVVDFILKEYRDLVGKRPIIVDSAVPELIKLLKRAGFNAIPAIKGPNSVFDGIVIMKQYPINVHQYSFNIIDEFESYIWKWDDKENKATDIPVDMFNHSLDAIRYVIQTHGKRYWKVPVYSTSKRNERPERTPRRERFVGF